MSLEDIMTAQLNETKEVKLLLRQLLEATSNDLVSVTEAATKLHISPTTLGRRLTDGTYTRYQNGKLIRVSLSEIRARMMEEGK